MRLRLTPQDTSFPALLTALADRLVEATTVLAEFLGGCAAHRAHLAERMAELEHHGHEATYEVLRLVGSSFILPFDREDVHSVASRLDHCLEEMQAAVDLVVIHRLDELPTAVFHTVQVLVRQAELTAAAMPMLRSAADLGDYWVEVDRLESQADAIHRGLLGELFGGGYDVLTALRTKEVADALERATDAFEAVAHAVQTIALKGT